MLEEIREKFGKFISLEEKRERKIDKRCARILIEMDIRNELYEEIMLDIKGSIWNRKLDYWKILFKYFGCRQGGHNIHDFLFPTNTTHPIRKIWVKNLPRMVGNKEGEGVKKKGD